MKSIIFTCLLLSIIACKQTPKFEMIEFSTGGGVTGEMIRYQLDSDGNVYMESSLTKQKALKTTLSRDQVKEIHELLLTLIDFFPEKEETGNITRAITYKKGERLYHTSWSPEIPALSAADMVFHAFIQKLNKP